MPASSSRDQTAGTFRAVELNPPIEGRCNGCPSTCIGPSATPLCSGVAPVSSAAKFAGVCEGNIGIE